MHTRLAFKLTHKLAQMHHTYWVTKMQVLYQVGWRYPSLPQKRDTKTQLDPQELYAQYMLSIFHPWSATMNNKYGESTTWWPTLQEYL